VATEHRDSELTERPIRAVFDANIYVAAYLSKNPRSPNKELFRRRRAREFTLLVSHAILEEVIEKFDQRGIDQALTLELVSFILADAEYIVTSDEALPALIVDDPDDDLILACAMAGNAGYLVTYDPHFDYLGGKFQGIRVLDGLHFLYVVRGDTRPA
jgi:putative PIN family toxin of toxin-antitoxin system